MPSSKDSKQDSKQESRRSHPYQRPPPTEARNVASHYNARPAQTQESRKESKIYKLRAFNNWIKSVAIAQATAGRRGLRVLDMGCGKGGDLLKWKSAGIGEYVGVDIAEVSIQQAQTRYNDMRRPKFAAEFHAMDCFGEPLTKVLPPERKFDIVSLQFCFHYSYESEARARQTLHNISEALVAGGRWIATFPNANWIVANIQKAAGLEIANSVFSIRFEDKTSFPKYGAKYWFELTDAIDDCPEYLVHFPSLQKLAKEYRLECELVQPFWEFYQQWKADAVFLDLMGRVGLLRNRDARAPPQDEDLMSADEWKVARMFSLSAVLTKGL